MACSDGINGNSILCNASTVASTWDGRIATPTRTTQREAVLLLATDQRGHRAPYANVQVLLMLQADGVGGQQSI